jgi:hypothetical protein
MARGAAINPSEGCGGRATTGAAVGQLDSLHTSAVWNHQLAMGDMNSGNLISAIFGSCW